MKTETLEGKVIFDLRNKGSKNEHLGPVLQYIKDDKAQNVALLYRNDNPFENKQLVPYDGKYVQVKGELILERFIVDSIKEIEQP
ncbi:hypothetical protein HZA97_03000 [Candidatus Woesearchaeota archaeon]|nr:hypothetical protein [Candidatus Woesearchaeota archaeon]